nr:protein of unknown function DUF4168 [uncultured organism]
MKFHQTLLISGAAVLFAPAALAQTTQTSPAPATTPPSTADGTATATAGAAVTDTEVTQFATAALAAGKVREDASITEADKNARMVEAITATGLAPTRFNEIAAAMKSDPALNTRIQAAAAAQTPAAAASPTTQAPAAKATVPAKKPR